jgi:hypothetical protein
VPLILDHARGDEQNKKVDRIEAREAGEPELALVEILATVGVVVSKDVTGDEEEDADEDVSVVDKRVQNAEMGRREVEENDKDGKQCPNACEGGELWLAKGRRPRSLYLRLFDFELMLCFEEA